MNAVSGKRYIAANFLGLRERILPHFALLPNQKTVFSLEGEGPLLQNWNSFNPVPLYSVKFYFDDDSQAMLLPE